MGVITLTDIDYGQIFGPFPASQTKTDPAAFIGLLTKDKQVDGILLKVDLMENKDRTVEWLPYIQPARDEEEQNIEAYMKDGYVYYRALRIIKRNEDLFVWYSKDFSQILAIPEVQRKQRDSDPYICPRCGELFEYPFPLRAHLRFSCEPRSLMTLSSNHFVSRRERLLKLESMDEESRIRNYCRTLEFHSIRRNNGLGGTEVGEKVEPTSLIKDYSRSRTLSDQNRKRHLDDIESSPSPKKIPTDQLEKIPERSSQLESNNNNSNTINNNSNNSNNNNNSNNDNNNNNNNNNGNNNHNNNNNNNNAKTPTRISPHFSDSTENPLKFRENTEENRSAFKKVEKLHSPSGANLSLGSSATNGTGNGHSIGGNSGSSSGHAINSPIVPSKVTLSPPIAMTFPVTQYNIPTMASMRLTSSTASTDATQVSSANALYLPRYPVFPSFGLTAATAAAAAAAAASQPLLENHSPQSIMEIYKNGLVQHTTEHFGSENSLSFPKHPIFAERPNVNPFIKTHNPMVEKIIASSSPTMLHTPLTSLNLSQNWCAKCNATFRMTSDLVYHMRSHHKREFDPMKRKREDKLKCTICNETFRERHHLTRHMTSHV